MYPHECTDTDNSSDYDRKILRQIYKSQYLRKSSRLPPIIAYVIGNPKAPALNDDSDVPPVAMEIGNLPCSTRG